MSENIAVRQDYTEEITALIRGNASPKVLAEKLGDYHGSDIAQAIESFTSADRRKLFRVSKAEMIAEAFEYLEEDTAGEYLAEMEIKKAAEVVTQLETDTAAGVLHEVEKEKRALIISELPEDIRHEIELIASFDEDDIGSRATANYIVINEDLSVKQAMNELVRQAEDNDNISTIFVTDENGEFCGAIGLKELITARSSTSLADLIMTSFPYVYAREGIDDCIERLKDYSEELIPVLDDNNRLLGVITSKSLIEVVDDEMSEDYIRLAGLTAEEDLKEPLNASLKKRLPWLMILLGLGMLVSSVVGVFEQVIAQLTVIMAFQSLILDMAGNVGTQSLAVTIRVLTDEALTASQKWKLVGKEMRVGFCIGLLIGVISFIFVGGYILIFKDRAADFSFAVSGCIGISMLAAMVISSAVGTVIPLFFKRIGVDPAVASGPLITTVNDLVAVVSYYGLSWLLLIKIFSFSS